MTIPSSPSRILNTTLLLFVLVFAVIEYANLSLLGANIAHNMDWYLGQDGNVKKYNESLFLAEKGDFTGAKSVLSPLLNEKNLENPSDVFELYGDLVYSMSGATGDILPFYLRALEYGENLRVEQKISMIENPSSPADSGSTDTGTGIAKNPETASGSSSGSMSRETKKQELKQLQENRKGAVNFAAPMPGETQKEVQGVWSILEGGEEKKEW